jgi:hypothetical protein
MADDDEEEAEAPAVELGDGEPVDGAPIARVASRLTWPKQRSEIDRLEGDSTIRTPDGPQTLSNVLPETKTTYYDRRQEFVDEIERVVGTGPVPTADE